MATRATAARPALAPKPTTVPLTAKEIMQTPVIAATPRASLRDLAARLVTNEFSGMPVADADGRVIGVITEADIIRALLEGKRLENLTAGEVMTGPALTVDAYAPLEEVMKCLQEHRIVRVPVTAEGKLIGIVARRDLIRAHIEPEFMVFRETL
ncbi:MAG TPA: CBS domain-containing protein [Candidatus Angelobacter sp.]|nr:CBS domain-containing protein [Candidatus Angelobacter sp.]